MGKKDLRNPAMESQTDLLIRNKIKDAFDTVSTGDLKAFTIQFVMESRHRTDTTTEERTVLPMKRNRKAGT